MRYFLSFIALLSVSLYSCVPTKQLSSYPNPFAFKVIDSVTATKDVLFVRAQEWAAKTFGNSNYAVKLADKEAGKIVAKSMLLYSSTNMPGSLRNCNSAIRFNITIDTKEGKYRMELADFVHDGCTGGGLSGGSLSNPKPSSRYMTMDDWMDVKRAAKDRADFALKSFTDYMKSKNTPIDDGF